MICDARFCCGQRGIISVQSCKMSASLKRATGRYFWARFFQAVEEGLAALQGPVTAFPEASTSGSAPAASQGLMSSLSNAVVRFRAAYSQQMTTTMYITGTQMAPALNKRGLKHKDSVELLVLRNLPRPSSRTVFVGDVVAFASPLHSVGSTAQQDVMVRRIAAMEGEEMVSTTGGAEEETYSIPPGHCWVLADNPDLRPPEVIDSRSFGHIPLSNIVGRVIYAVSSKSDHGPVTNHPLSNEEDAAIIEAEVDVEELLENEK